MDLPNVDQQSVVCWNSSAVATDVNGEVILMSMERDRCYGLGSTGSDIWRGLSDPIRVSDLIAQLNTMYQAQPGRIEEDVLKTLSELAAEGLIDVRS